MSFLGRIKVFLVLAAVGFCLCEFLLHRQSGIIRELESVFLALSWILFVCLVVWCGTFLILTFGLNDLPLAGLLLIGGSTYFISTRPGVDVFTLLAGVTLGKGARFFLDEETVSMENGNLPDASEYGNQKSESENFAVGLVVLLAILSWWHLDMSGNFYHGLRWMGLWNNPNIYGMLMSAGVLLAVGLLAVGLLAARLKAKG